MKVFWWQDDVTRYRTIKKLVVGGYPKLNTAFLNPPSAKLFRKAPVFIKSSFGHKNSWHHLSSANEINNVSLIFLLKRQCHEILPCFYDSNLSGPLFIISSSFIYGFDSAVIFINIKRQFNKNFETGLQLIQINEKYFSAIFKFQKIYRLCGVTRFY